MLPRTEGQVKTFLPEGMSVCAGLAQLVRSLTAN